MLGPEQIRKRAIQECAGDGSAAIVEVCGLSGDGMAECSPSAPRATKHIGVFHGDLQQLGTLFRNQPQNPIRISRLISAVAVIDFSEEGPIIREVAHGFTARDIQEALSLQLWASPDLKELSA